MEIDRYDCSVQICFQIFKVMLNEKFKERQ